MTKSSKTHSIIFLLIIMTAILFIASGAYLARTERQALLVGMAESFTQTLDEMHDYYSKEILPRAVQNGTPLTHDVDRDETALPFPATFLNNFGKRLEAREAGLSASLYSDTPFPWAENRKLSGLQLRALQTVKADPETPYIYREVKDGTEVLHLARAVIMQESCLGCHNAYDSKLGRPWKVDDVRGVRDVSMPVQSGPSSDPKIYILAGFAALLAAALGAAAIWPMVERLNAALRQSEMLGRELQHMAHHDALTGLPSLNLGRDRLEQAMAAARRNKSKTALFFIDLDGFKAVNDGMGHKAGDEVLMETAARMRGALRETDTAARIGGDEFIAVLGGINWPDDVEEAARRMIDAVKAPILLRDGQVEIGASIGIALYPDDGTDSETLMRRADEAMYAVKKTGKNNFARYVADAAS